MLLTTGCWPQSAAAHGRRRSFLLGPIDWTEVQTRALGPRGTARSSAQIACRLEVCYRPLATAAAAASSQLRASIAPGSRNGGIGPRLPVHIRTPDPLAALGISGRVTQSAGTDHVQWSAVRRRACEPARVGTMASRACSRSRPRRRRAASPRGILLPPRRAYEARDTTPLRRPRTTKAVTLAALPTLALYESTTQLINDVGCTAARVAPWPGSKSGRHWRSAALLMPNSRGKSCTAGAGLCTCWSGGSTPTRR